MGARETEKAPGLVVESGLIKGKERNSLGKMRIDADARARVRVTQFLLVTLIMLGLSTLPDLLATSRRLATPKNPLAIWATIEATDPLVDWHLFLLFLILLVGACSERRQTNLIQARRKSEPPLDGTRKHRSF